MPYYISNLNIEYTYKQATGKYEEFKNLCFVDTLDNTGFAWQGKQTDMFGLSAENVARIRNQNNKKISVIIGNPPYNVGQKNENDNNQNQKYPVVDKRIRDTFIRYSTAQKTKLYDMYSRFYRWAMDRVDENGIISFITNRSFIESRTFDGFRRCIQSDFDFAYIIDTKSDVRVNPKIAGSTHNVFGIQAGVAILFLVRSANKGEKGHPCHIQYIALEDEWRKEIKLQWLAEHRLENIEFETILPDKNNNWIGIVENDWDSLIQIVSKEVKFGKSEAAIFKNFSTGINSGRDEWVLDFDKKNVTSKMAFYLKEYLKVLEGGKMEMNIKWSRNLKTKLKNRKKEEFKAKNVVDCQYRPFVKQALYNSKLLIDERSNSDDLFGAALNYENFTIAITGPNSGKPFLSLAIDQIGDYHFVGAGASSQFIPLYHFTSESERFENITDWGLKQFRNYYHKAITKEEIFYYVYAVLHHPAYRNKYSLNLKREFPRIPFYDNFQKWAKWGKQLIDLHINYETVPLYTLSRKEIDNKLQPKPKLKAFKEKGIILIDENTELHGIPQQAWEYKLGNRSAIEWILDQYKEKKPTDPTIEKRFKPYHFIEYKEHVIKLLMKICTVSVRTMEIVAALP